MHPQEADYGEITQHAIEGSGAVFSGDSIGVFVAFHGEELLIDLGALNEGVKDVEYGIAAPGVGVFAKEGRFGIFIVGGGGGGGARDAVSVAAEGLELVDELVNYVPGPVVLWVGESHQYLSNKK